MTVCNFIILVCLWIAIGIIVYHLVKIRSTLFDIRTSQCARPQGIEKETKYVPFFDLFDIKSFRKVLQECIQGKYDVEIDLQSIISEQTPENAVKYILKNYNVTPKEKEERNEE